MLEQNASSSTCSSTYPSSLKHVCARTPPAVNQTMSINDVIWQRIVTIYSDYSSECGLQICSVTKNSDYIYRRICLSRPPLNMFGHVPPSQICSGKYPPVMQTLFRYDVIWQTTVTIYNDDSCKVWLTTK